MANLAPKNETALETTDPAPADFWSQVDRWFRDVHDGFYSMTRTFPSLDPQLARTAVVPALTDISDQGDRYAIVTDLPGVSKETIELKVSGNTVDIRANTSASSERSDRAYLRRERIWSGFQRQIELPEPVRADDVTARFENGVLTVSVPKAHPVVEKKVAVQ
jgi:HSP20 family molecular chaperone IbpA